MPTTKRGRVGHAWLAAASFAVARVRARPLRGLVTGLGIGIAIVSLFVMTASPIIAGDATLRRALQDVAPGERSISVAASVNSKTPAELAEIDAKVRAGLHAPGLGELRKQVEYRALAADDGTVFRLAGLDDLGAAVTLIDGRLPTECTPTHCEVVVVGADANVTLEPELDVEIVGRVALNDPGVLSGQFAPESTEVVLLGDGVDAVSAIAPLELIGRSLGWVAAIDPDSVRVSDIDAVLAAASRTANSFAEGGATVDLPRRALVNARARADTARDRVALAAAQGVVLVIAFALLAAASARRQHRAARSLLRQRGATRAATNVFTLCEAVWPVLIGLVVGIPLGLVATGSIARHWDFDPGDVISDVVASSIPRLIVGAIVVLIATAVVMSAAPSDVARATRPWWRPMAIDVLGAAALAMGALAVGRGAATPPTLVADGDPLIAALPLLASLTVAWIAIRVVPTMVATVARLLRRRAPLARVALGEVARRPTIPLVTAGFLAAATTLGLFSLGYRSTLAAGAHDQAAFAVPLDFTVTSGSALVRPSSIAPAGGWSSLAPGIVSTEVLRRGVSVHSQQSTTDTVTVLGIDPAAMNHLSGWRRDFGPSPASLASRITPTGSLPTFGNPIPTAATELLLHGSGDFATTDVSVIIERSDGTWHEVSSRYLDAEPDSVRVRLDTGDGGGRLIGFVLGQPGTAAQKIEHHVGEGLTGAEFFTATVALDTVTATVAGVATEVPIDWSVLGSDGATVTQEATGVSVALRLQGSAALVVPPTPTQLAQIPAIVDPTSAASAQNGLLVVDVPGDSRMTLRVVGVANRFPGAPGRFAVLDRNDLQLAFDLLNPGFGTANEVWLSVPAGQRDTVRSALGRAPFDQLVTTSRASIERRLSSDPLARFTLGLFAVAALIAGVLAIAAIYLATTSDATEQAPLHRALAAEGVAARSLSGMVRTASIAITVAAIAIGTIGAVLLLRVVTRVITVTATSSVPVPPLLNSVSAVDLVAAVAVLAVPCCLAATLAARSARRAAHGDLLREFG